MFKSFKSMKFRIMIVMVGITLVISLITMYVATNIIENSLVETEKNSAQNVLNLAYMIVESQYSSMEYYKERALKYREKELKDILLIHKGYMDHLYDMYKKKRYSFNYIKKRILDETRYFRFGNSNYIWMANYRYWLVSHPDPKHHNKDHSKLRDLNNKLIVPPMVDMAKEKGEGTYTYLWHKLGSMVPIRKLAYFLNHPKFKWVTGTGVYIDDIENEYNKLKEEMIKEIKRRFSEIKISKTGYIFIFSKDYEMLVHPTIKRGTDISKLKDPVTKNLIIDELKGVADKNEPLVYMWDKPNLKNNYIFKKVSFVKYFKPLGWYIVSSMYEEEILTPLHKLKSKILLFNIIFLILVIIIALYISKTLSSPLSRLTKAISSISKKGIKDADIVQVKGTNETTELANNFNSMVEKLKEEENINNKLMKELEEYSINLEKKVNERTKDLYEAMEQLQESTNSIMESITYARMIQNSLLPPRELSKQYFKEFISLWKPRDLVGGDYYYISRLDDNKVVIGVFDCTGHGVAGAFMTMIVASAMLKIISEDKCHKTNEILRRLNLIVKTVLKQDDKMTMSDNGLDAGICIIDSKEKTIEFSGAKISLYEIMDNSEIKEYKANKFSLGYKKSRVNYKFNTYNIKPKDNSYFFIFTDGIYEQPGGEKGLPMGKNKFLNKLVEIVRKNDSNKVDEIFNFYNDYIGDKFRVDDITLIGFKI